MPAVPPLTSKLQRRPFQLISVMADAGALLAPPAELIGSTADGAISTTGPAMQQQMDRPATAALEQGRNDDDRAMGQHRRRQ
jgi:hypothetical protein